MGKYTGKKCRLLSMMCLTLVFFVVEIVVGYKTNSMALIADSFHMFADVAALIISFLSRLMSPKKWSKNTFGWARAEVLGALVNAVFLVALCLSITIEAFKRILEEQKVHDPELLVIVGVIGFFINLVGLFLLFEHGGHGHSHGHSHNHAHGHLHGHPHVGLARRNNRLNDLAIIVHGEDEPEECGDTDANEVPTSTLNLQQSHHVGHSHHADHMNMRGAFLHVLTDAIGSIIVVFSAVIVWQTNWAFRFYIDPVLSVVLVCLILHSVWPLLRESALVLLQTVPPHINVDAIEKSLLEEVNGVLSVHELHVWQLAGERIIATAHVRCHNLADYMKIGTDIKEFFHHVGIHSTTIQLEFLDGDYDVDLCAFDCPLTEEGCVKATCCQIDNRNRSPSPRENICAVRQRNIARHSDNADAISSDFSNASDTIEPISVKC